MGGPFLRSVPVVPFLEGVMDVRVPYYQGTHMTRISYASGFSDSFLERSPIIIGLRPVVNSITTTTTNYCVQRSVADDFSMGFLYAPPPMQVAYNFIA